MGWNMKFLPQQKYHIWYDPSLCLIPILLFITALPFWDSTLPTRQTLPCPLSLKHWLLYLNHLSLPKSTKPFSLASFFCIVREDITGIKSKISVPHNSYTILLLFTISVHKTDYLTLNHGMIQCLSLTRLQPGKVRNCVPWFQGHTQCPMQSRVGTCR